MIAGKFSRFRRDTRGVAAIEAGLAFPFLVLFGAGLFEYGGLFYNYQLAQTGVRDGAAISPASPTRKRLSRPRAISLFAAPSTRPAARGFAGGSRPTSRSPIGRFRTPSTRTTGLRLYRGDDPLTVIRMSTSVNYDGLGLLTAVGLGPIAVRAAHEERYVGL